jgi:hypothetical protein
MKPKPRPTLLVAHYDSSTRLNETEATVTDILTERIKLAEEMRQHHKRNLSLEYYSSPNTQRNPYMNKKDFLVNTNIRPQPEIKQP